MATSASPNRLNAPAVYGLDQGRHRARQRAGRRRMKNTIVSGVMFVVAGGVVGGGGYYLWEFYTEERDRDTGGTDVVDQRTTDELIDDFEDNPRFNGPGAPAFGVGDGQP